MKFDEYNSTQMLTPTTKLYCARSDEGNIHQLASISIDFLDVGCREKPAVAATSSLPPVLVHLLHHSDDVPLPHPQLILLLRFKVVQRLHSL